ncbi:MAG: hypothetical protein HC896_14350 [Bacteroidales bacterium]|nr:hypothetical protein [Bacteroidales bacterium]
MPGNRHMLLFLLKAVLVYALLVGGGLLLKLDGHYGPVFRKKHTNVFKNALSNCVVEFKEVKKSAFDTNIILTYTNARQHISLQYYLDAWYLGYIPKALLIALMLATRFATVRHKFVRWA